MKFLFAIVSCRRFSYGLCTGMNGQAGVQHWNSATNPRVGLCRNTWLKYVPDGADYKFFFGGLSGREGIYRGLPDEVNLPCQDDYMSLPAKVKAMCEWAYDRQYDYMLKIDDDTYCHPNRVIHYLHHGRDYIGYCLRDGRPASLQYAHGPAYILSRKSMEVIKNARLTANFCEDSWVGYELYKAGIELTIDERFSIWPKPDVFSNHSNPAFTIHCEGYPNGFQDLYKLGEAPLNPELQDNWRPEEKKKFNLKDILLK